MMPRLTSKEFKKLYATSMDNIPEKGVWSGRGIGIPVAGAIGGGDDYKQKIGRGKLPDFRTGRPTQGADSTFSSYLARVNTGYDDYDKAVEYMPMFPEQEEEVGDIYSWDIEPIRSRKLPNNFRIMRPKQKGLKEKMEFDENTPVFKSRYSLLDHRMEEGISDTMLVKGAKKGLTSLGLSIPYIDVILGGLLGTYSVMKLKSDSDELISLLDIPENAFFEALSEQDEGAWQQVIASIQGSDTVQLKAVFDQFLDRLKSFFILLIQSMDSVVTTAAGMLGPQAAVPEELVTVPLANLITGIGGFVADIVPVERFLFDMAASGAGVVEDVFEIMRTSSPEAAESLEQLAEEGGPGLAGVIFSPVRSFRRLGEFYRALHAEPEDAPTQLVKKGVLDMDKDSFLNLLSAEAGGLPTDITALNTIPMQSNGVSPALSELKRFIRESIYPDYSSYHEDKPVGYKSRNVPTIVTKQEAESVFDRLDDYDDFSVAYKADGGIVNYQARSLEEKALRNLIRQGIERILESKKKK